MGVLQPWLFALAAAAAIPLLLHLLQRHQGPRVSFPALRYLRRAEKESARRIRLRQLLLMVLRVVAVLLVAGAAARPFLLGAGAAHQPSAVVIILDNSLSTAAVTGERRVLDELRERALETLAAAGPEDRFWLLRTSPPGEPALPGDALTTARRVRETVPAGTTAELAAALARASTILAASSEGRAPEIQLLTDLQASEWHARLVLSPAPPLVVWTPRGPPPANHSVGPLALAGGIAPLAGTRTAIAVPVHGTGTARVGLRLFVDERMVAAGGAPPGAAAVLSLPPRPAGLLTGHVEADADALRADDRRYFAVHVRPPPAVWASAASPFLADALAVLESAGRARAAPAAEADVALLSAGAGLERVGPGTAVVIVPPASPVELPALNGRLAAAGIGWRYAPAPPGGDAQLAIADSTDPVLRTLATVRLSAPYVLAPNPGNADSVLLRTRAGAPWLVRGTRSGETWLLLASPLSPEATSIPTSAAMMPLLDRVLTVWAAATAPPAELQPGDEVVLGAGRSVLHPDGSEEPVGSATYRIPGEPGIYRVRAGDSVVSAFAVNVPAAESDLRRARAAAVHRMLPEWTVRTVDSPPEWGRAVYHARLGLQLWRPLLLALLVLLLVEAFIAASGARRPAAARGVETA